MEFCGGGSLQDIYHGEGGRGMEGGREGVREREGGRGWRSEEGQVPGRGKEREKDWSEGVRVMGQ